MVGNSFVDDLDCGSFFDHIDDLLDFPVEDVDAGLPPAKGGDSGNSFPTIWSTQSEALPGSDSVFSANRNSDLSADLSVPYEDIVQLEWLSNFVEDSFCGGGSLAMSKEEPKDLTHTQFQTSSPVSVLESSSSCSSDKSLPRSPEPTIATPAQQRGRARSKRPRPATFCPRPPIQLISPASSVSETTHDHHHHHQVLQVIAPKTTSDSDNFAESRPLVKMPKHGALGMQKKNKKIKLSFSLAPLDGASQNSPSQSMRKCMHCEITKTPQWRAGPMGPKTLCNACGVRYKSGRLFPEYRPAASPTFVPSLHSNSHKKVLEMRNKTDEKTAANVITITVQPELIPNTNSAISMDYM